MGQHTSGLGLEPVFRGIRPLLNGKSTMFLQMYPVLNGTVDASTSMMSMLTLPRLPVLLR